MVEGGRRSPLAGYAERFSGSRTAAVQFAEIPFTTQLNLRVDSGSAAARDAARVLGGALPIEPNTARRYGVLDVLWLGPDEWLVVAPDGAHPDLETALRAALGDRHASVVDVSAHRTVIEIAGPCGPDVLARGCTLDLHPSALGAGRCVQTAIAQTHVVLLVVADERIWLFVRASFAEHLAEWLLDATLEERVQYRLDGQGTTALSRAGTGP